MWEQTYKPGSVPPLRAVAVISLERALPRASSSRPGDSAGSLISPYVALHRAGFAQVAGRPALRALLPHDFTLTGLSHPRKRKFRRYVSVALSFGLPRLGVTQRPALWCPDFPPEASLSLGLRRSPGLLPVHPSTLCQGDQMTHKSKKPDSRIVVALSVFRQGGPVLEFWRCSCSKGIRVALSGRGPGQLQRVVRQQRPRLARRAALP